MTHPDRFFDIAHEGAQLRATAALVSWAENLRPRSVIILVNDDLGNAAASAAIAWAEPLTVPVVIVRQLPSYTGALDLVLALSERGEDDIMEAAVASAVRRGAYCALVAPAAGPLHREAPQEAYLLPALPGVSGPSPARFYGAVFAILRAVAGSGTAADIDAAADSVDEELAACAPSRDESTNPARQLLNAVAGARVVHSGHRSIARVVATLWAAAGKEGTITDSVPVAPPADDIFFDPYLDGDRDLLPLRMILWGSAETQLPHAVAVAAGDGHPFTRAARLISRGYAALALEERP